MLLSSVKVSTNEWLAYWKMKSLADPGEEPGGPAPLSFRPNLFWRLSPSLSKARGPPLSQGLDPALEGKLPV